MTVIDSLPDPPYVGTAVLCTGTFTNAGSNTPADPSTIQFKWVVAGSGQPPTTWTYGTTGSIVRVSTGVYSATVTLNLAGGWTMEWIGRGNVAAVNAVTFAVTADPI
jgi:hypothetical protein